MNHLEVHQHAIIRGERANKSWCNTIMHSHEGGEQPHKHADTGPACYTIDKDEWRAKTGLESVGRKKFTRTPTGEQLPIVELEDWQRSFDIIIHPPPAGHRGVGPGLAPAHRMIVAFGMTVGNVIDLDSERRARR